MPLRKCLKNLLPLFAAAVCYSTHAQTDTLVMAPIRKHSFLAEAVIPAALIGAGVLVNRTKFEKSVNRGSVGMFRKEFRSTVDDYLRFAPIAQMYIADAVGIKAKNHWFDQTKNLAISMLVTDFIVHQIKKATQKTRPNGAELAHSFPSAHTALASVSATMLFEEFRESSPLLALSGYGFSTATGTLRMLNNAHWLSDVLVGAGVGILVTKAVYLLDPIIAWNPFKNKNDIILLPQIDGDSYGLYFSKRF